MKSFIDRLVSGEIEADALDDFIDAWHLDDRSIPLHTFLGLSFDDWGVVALQPCALKYVVQARKAGLETGFPVIIDCACGKDHMTMPTDTEFDEDGTELPYELVCRVHRKHIPCRPCIRRTP